MGNISSKSLKYRCFRRIRLCKVSNIYASISLSLRLSVSSSLLSMKLFPFPKWRNYWWKLQMTHPIYMLQKNVLYIIKSHTNKPNSINIFNHKFRKQRHIMREKLVINLGFSSFVILLNMNFLFHVIIIRRKEIDWFQLSKFVALCKICTTQVWSCAQKVYESIDSPIPISWFICTWRTRYNFRKKNEWEKKNRAPEWFSKMQKSAMNSQDTRAA